MPLTHIRIMNAKPRERSYKMSDAEAQYLVVRPNGAKLWRMNYRFLGRQKTLYFGSWPEVGIADARGLRDVARKKIRAEIDPAVEKKVARITRKISANNTFKAIAEEWMAKNKREELSPVTLRKIRWLLGIAYPMIGNRPITEITPQEALAVLRKVEATGRYESARRMRSVISRVCRYAIATARADRDVVADLRGALTTPKVKHHAASHLGGRGIGYCLTDADGFGLEDLRELEPDAEFHRRLNAIGRQLHRESYAWRFSS